VTVTDGPYATHGPVKGPEYETVCSFGSMLLVDDLPLITALGNLCDRLGLDVVSAGSTLSLAYLLFERGLLSEADTGGLSLVWGDAAPCFGLLESMARREGFGALLAQGAKALAAHCGAEELAVQVNNLEVPMHDPRAFSGQTLSYLLSPRGACHNNSDYFNIELGGSLEDVGVPMTPRDEDGGKAHYVARHQHWRSACNNLPLCFFAVTPVSTLLELLSAATGQPRTLEDVLRVGERSWNLKRLVNLRLGWTREREKLPYLLRQPLEGGQMGHVPDEALLLDEYYTASGWDPASGAPLPEKIKELNLGFASASVAKA
jgi:aldehyde:ferredoxin oxidoreductase